MLNGRGLFIWLCSLSALMATAASDASSNDNDLSECGIWLAQSTTSVATELKIGLFAGSDYAENEIVGRPDIAIPLIDFIEDWNRRSDAMDAVLHWLEGLLWTGDFAGNKFEGESNTALIPGFGILAQYHSGIYNIDWEQGAALLRDPPAVLAPGVNHPSRGAISPYYNLTMKATRPIKAGMELFANFGDVWDGNETADAYGDKLTRWDYNDADAVVDKVLAFMDKYDDQMSPKLKDEVLDFIMLKVLGVAAGSRSKAIRSLIPAHPGKLQTVKDMGGTFAFRNPDLVKSPKWLKKHGVCMDNLESKPSTIPEAGRGAFSTRSLKKDSVIVPMPLVHITDSSVMDRYVLQTHNDASGAPFKDIDLSQPLGQQLATNYCFGHPESSMLLLPVASQVSQINHAPAEQANARIAWSNHKYMGNAHDWHDLTPEELTAEEYEYIGLVMEVVAKRDIEKGEEITIDYGSDWSKAWDAHMQAHAKQDKSCPLVADDMKLRHKNKPFKTEEELRTDPYPEGIANACFIETESMTDGMPKVTEDGDQIGLWASPLRYEDYKGSNMYACDVLERTDKLSDGNLYNYTVSAKTDDSNVQVMNVPHRAITFMDLPYTSDIHTPTAFRHWIGVPDMMWPQAWRNQRDQD